MSETLGRYRLLKRIAAGGMAEIWLAKQAGAQGFEKLVVVKRILEHLAHDEQFVEMFLDEARLAAGLSHPNIVQIFDLGGDEGSWYIAMEHIHGENLRVILRRRHLGGTPGFPLNIAVRVASHTCQALYYAHTKKGMDGEPLNVVHRDVSPQNILVSYDGQVKVVDFGIAKAATQNQVTRTGVIKGKFAYMSPEQCLGKKLDGRSDQFAVGSVLWELLTGKRLFERDNEILTFKAITEEEAPSPRSANPEIPQDLESIVMKALSRDPDDRYPDCNAMHSELERFLLRAEALVSPVEIASFMEGLFEDRLDSWREVVDLAREGKSVDSGLLEGRSDLFEMSLTPSSSKVPRVAEENSASEPSIEDMIASSLEEEESQSESPAGPGQGAAGTGPPNARRDVVASTRVTGGERTALPAEIGDEATILAEKSSEVDTFVRRRQGTDSGDPRIEPMGTEVPESAPPPRRRRLAPIAGIGAVVLAAIAVAVVGLPIIGPVDPSTGHEGSSPVVQRHDRDLGEDGNEQWAGDPREEPAPQPGQVQPDDSAGSGDVDPTIAREVDPPAGGGAAEPSPPPAEEGRVEAPQDQPRIAKVTTEPAPTTRPVRRPPPGRRPVAAGTADAASSEREPPPASEPEPRRQPAAPGKLTLNARPWCRAFIGSRELGVTPIFEVEVPAGRHTVRCVNPEIGEQSIVVDVPSGEDVRRSIALLGELRFRVRPWAKVYLDGAEIGMTPLAPRELPAGRYRVRLLNEDMGVDRTINVEIKGGETFTVDQDFR